MTPVTPVLPSQPPMPETVLGRQQPQYQPLPVIISIDHQGIATSRWKLTWLERLKLLLTGDLYLQVMTFHQPLMPLLPSVDEPEAGACLRYEGR